MPLHQWWNEACDPMGSCLTAWITAAHVCVFPVWNNPNDPTYWKVKIKNLKTGKWTKADGRVCDRHHMMIMAMLTAEAEEDIKTNKATDDYAIKYCGGF